MDITRKGDSWQVLPVDSDILSISFPYETVALDIFPGIFRISIPAPFFRHTCPADYALEFATTEKNMQKEINLTRQETCYSPALNSVQEHRIRTNLYRIFDHLNETGKVCPKPWYWKRFFILYKPRYEPCWLSSWWETSVEEKKELFHKQLRYLAYNTDRFHEACQSLYAIDQNNWYYR